MSKVLDAIKSVFKKKRRICVSAVILLTIAGLYVHHRVTETIIFERTSNTAELVKAADILLENGIKAELVNNGAALAVPKKSVDAARLLIAGNSVFTSELAFAGNASTDEETRKQLQIIARQSEIEKSIETLKGIASVAVMLSIPDDTAPDNPPSASVVLDAPDGISDEQLNSIALYISKCVTDMKPEDVSIAASDGKMLY